MISSYLNQTAEKKGSATTEFYNGPAKDESMVSGLDVADFEGVTSFHEVWIIVSGGDPATGTVTITGKDDYDNPQSEDVNINGNHEFCSYDHWSKIDTITSADLTDETPIPNLIIKIWDQTEAYVETFGWDAFACRWEENPVIKPSGGGWDYSDGKVTTKENIEIGDIIKYNETEVTVLDVQIKRDLAGVEKYRIVVY